MPTDPKALTHDQMVKVIQSGGSVMHKGQVIHVVSELPPPEALVEDEAAKQKLIDDLEVEELKLRQRREALAGKSFVKQALTVDESDKTAEDEFTRLAREADEKKAADEAAAKKTSKK